jgi:hypothetical protein
MTCITARLFCCKCGKRIGPQLGHGEQVVGWIGKNEHPVMVCPECDNGDLAIQPAYDY